MFPPLWISMRERWDLHDRAWDLSFIFPFAGHKSVSMVSFFPIYFFSISFSLFLRPSSLSVYTLYLLGFLFLAGWLGVYECLVCLYITHTVRSRFFMVCDYIFHCPFLFYLLTCLLLFFSFLLFHFSSRLLRYQKNGIGIRLGLYGGENDCIVWMVWDLVQICILVSYNLYL